MTFQIYNKFTPYIATLNLAITVGLLTTTTMPSEDCISWVLASEGFFSRGGGQLWWNLISPTRNYEKNIFTETLIGKYQILHSRGQGLHLHPLLKPMVMEPYTVLRVFTECTNVWVLYQNNFNRTEMMKLMLLQSFFIDNQYVICHSCFCVSHFCGCIFVDWSVVHKKTKKQEKTTVQNCFTKDWCSWYNHLAETN